MCGPDDRFFSGAQRCNAIIEPSACGAFRACEETVLRSMCSVYGCTVHRWREEGEKGRRVVVVVRTMCYDDVSVDTVTRACTEFGWQNAWEQAPGVPATPEPSMTKNSSSSRAHLALNVRMDGARKRPVKRAKKPLSPPPPP